MLIDTIKQAYNDFLAAKFNLKDTANYEFLLNLDENKKDFGHINSNAALIIAKELKQNPRQIAVQIADNFKHEHVQKVQIAGPGFVNLFLKPEAFIELLTQLSAQKDNFFKLNPEQTKNTFYNLEFVSANPTGPLHFGHGRGGIIGDVLGNILKFLGYNTVKEFYINDAGNQITKLGQSLKVRCQQELGIDAQIPEEGYQGQYLIDLAKQCIKEFGTKILEKSDVFFQDYAKNHLLEIIKKTLEQYGIIYDVWFSEKSLHESEQVKKAIEKLKKAGHTFEQDGALWFKSTAFGDDKDRVIIKNTGEYTYVAADIAYMINKFERGANFLIMILGQDHHSYVVRLKGIQQALELEKYPLDVILYQLVKMKQSDQLVKMSKRAGNIITLQDIIDTVGKDVARFFYLNRKADAQLEFDLDLALKTTEENPVYYAQYAYVRTRSILEKAKQNPELVFSLEDAKNIGPEEYFIIKKIVSLKSLLEAISQNFQTHLLAYYILGLANAFHKYYSQNRIIDLQNIEKSRARLLITSVLKDTFETNLKLLGLSAPEKM